jgi:heparin/heparan-sulfate lyase
MALVYDWCNDWVAANGKQDTLQRRFLELAPLLEIGFPPTKQGAVVGHGSEAQVLRDQLSAAIAFYDEGADINKVYDIVAGRVLDTYVPVRDYIYQSRGMPQGTDYGPYRHQWDLFSALLFRAIDHPKVYSDDQRYVIHQNLYLRRPDKQYMRDGDVHKSSSTLELSKRTWKEQMPFLLSANLYEDSTAQFGFMRALPEWEDDLWVVLYLIPGLSSADPGLPLTAMYPDPLGMMVARTAWEHSATKSPVIATMKVGSTFFGNHQHFDAGHFQIYYKGALAIDSGAYNVKDAVGGLEEYNSKHRNNYAMRTVAHNAMVLYAEDETFGSLESNDGGQTYSAKEPANRKEVEDSKRAQTIAYAISQSANNTVAPEYSYLKGDLKGAYGSKATHYVRSFAFLNFESDTNPAALVVFDRLATSKPTTKKRWLLHSINAPSVDSARKSATFTIDTYLNDNRVTGKLVHQALLPDNLTMTIWGEKDSEDFIVDNRGGGKTNWDYIRPTASDSWEEPGRYRIELESENATTDTEIFLNVMQVMDGSAMPYAATKFSDTNFAGVVLADRAVMFAVAQTDFNSTASFQIPGSGTAKLLITDLGAGNWTLTQTGSTATTHVVQAGKGVLYATVTKGANYSLKKNN